MQFKELKNLSEIFEFLEYTPDKNFHYSIVPCEVCDGNSFTIVRRYQDGGNNTLLPSSVTACNDCGFMMQNPRFSSSFYDQYYATLYPLQRAKSDRNNQIQYVENSSGATTDSGYDNQYMRAKNLHSYVINTLKYNLDTDAKILDVGCGSGGFVQYFNDNGYLCLGNDPDVSAVSYAATRGIQIDCIPAEIQDYPENYFDFVFILGSLEHCKDPNEVLRKCFLSTKKGGLILIEGRTHPISHSTKYLNFNHHRFFRHRHMEAILHKHGFAPMLSTNDQICGENSGRSGMGYTFAIKTERPVFSTQVFDRNSFLTEIRAKGYFEDVNELIRMLNLHDNSLKCL
jgi:SAM-dependent methyltransferase